MSPTTKQVKRYRTAGRFAGSCLAALAATLAMPAGPLLAASPEEKILCSTLLTVAELNAISPGSESMAAIERSAGNSECSWSVKGDGDTNTLSLTFWEPGAMADALIPAESPAEFFEIYVNSAEQVRGVKGESVAGAGKRSALFRDGKLRELFLLTKAGVAHLLADGLNDAQITAVGKAVAAP